MDKLEQNINMKIFWVSSDHNPANFDAKDFFCNFNTKYVVR